MLDNERIVHLREEQMDNTSSAAGHHSLNLEMAPGGVVVFYSDGERPQDWIIEMLVASASIAPAELMEEVMADSRCPAFGPIHHFVVGATLLACRRNAEVATDREDKLRADLEEMLARSSGVPGATCARWGVCGAAASAGMAYSIVRGNAPLREEGWQEGQLMVSDLLARIARSGAPRCCKRDSRVAVAAAMAHFNALGGPQMAESDAMPTCASSGQNGACMGSGCPYYPGRKQCGRSWPAR